MANIDAALVQNIFDLPQAERKPDVIHNGKFDNFRAGFIVLEVIDL